MTDFFLKAENFAKLKKQFDSVNQAQSVRSRISTSSIKLLMKSMHAGNDYNAINNDLNKQRSKILDGWNNAVKRYMDEYIPVQKR